MADLGLLAGLAQGLSQGVGAYKEGERYKQEQALKQKMADFQNAGLYAQGVQLDESGNPAYVKGQDPASKESKKLRDALNQHRLENEIDTENNVKQALAIKKGEHEQSVQHLKDIGNGLLDAITPGFLKHKPDAAPANPQAAPPAQMLGKNPSLMQNANAGNKPKTAKPPAMKPPKVGEVIEGHTYLGGDPGNPKSWRKQ
jgi:hypothetical protein